MQPLNKLNSCGAVGPHLWEYATGALQADASDIARIEAHVSRCPKCRAAVEGFRLASPALNAYAAAPETGIPPRAANLEGVQARLGENEQEKTRPVAGLSWLRALRTRPAFAGATVGLGLCTALCAVSIPWALGQQNKSSQIQEDRGGSTATYITTAAPTSPVEMTVRPTFNDPDSLVFPPGTSQTFALCATVVNHTGQAMTAEFLVVDTGGLSARRYKKKVSLNADSKPQLVPLYPSVGGIYNYGQELRVTMTSPFPIQETGLGYNIYDPKTVKMALISGPRPGSLLPKQEVMEAYRKSKEKSDRTTGKPIRQYLSYSSGSARPERAPDRPVGYNGTKALVLGTGAERLTTAQRAALRTWVIGGGSVILLPGAGLDLLGIAPDAPFVISKPVTCLLSPETPLHRYTLGMGAALTVPIDLTADHFRDEWQLPYLWDDLRSRAAPIASADDLNLAGSYAYFEQGAGQSDPFQVALPPLASVVYLFAGYFLLAVPVTFVVLKQTRRMNWAWATGPALAVLFGGVVYGFTADLHKAKLSRRTGGFLISAAGEKQARFVGTSEMFFPSAGRYDVTVPGAETMEPGLTNSSYNGAGTESNGITLHSLEAVDKGTSVSVPELDVSNLAFRRLNHTQPVAWGEGITADLKITHDGKVLGTIYNGTGRTLDNAYIQLPTYKSPQSHEGAHGLIMICSRIAPGLNELNRITEFNQRVVEITDTPLNLSRITQGVAQLYTKNRLFRNASVPVLVATTSGQDLGPTIGQYVGSSDTVTVAVTLPPIRKAVSPAAQGGVK